MGGPYPPRIALLGGRPTVDVDVPVCAVFLALFLGFGISHMVIFRRNLARAWACRPNDVQIAIAAQIFVAAGILLLFILNLLYSQRMLRAALPGIGWSRPVSYAFKALYVLVVVSIIMVITCVVQSQYTLNANTLRIDRDIQLYGVTYFAIISFLPIPITLLVLLFSHGEAIEHPGSGKWSTKAAIVLSAAVLLCLGASFRAGTSWMPPRPLSNPPWYDHKACFYVFDFGIDISVVALFLIARVDRRFWVPNGSSAVRHYRGTADEPKGAPFGQGAGDHDLDGSDDALPGFRGPVKNENEA
ncbi:unnamed protein product [Penicillium pancosmium]